MVELTGRQGDARLSIPELTVLVVDDNDYIRDLILRLLYAMGFKQIIEATSGKAAQKILTEKPVGLVLSDWEMPGMSGLEFLKACREAAGTSAANTCFIMLTAHADRDNVIEAREAGVDGFVVKPISPRSLYERVVSALTIHQKKTVDDHVFL